jgi:hypothetical protein
VTAVGNDALQQIGFGLNNLNAAVLANQAASERRHAHLENRLDERFDALYKRLDEVCDRGGAEHKEFRDAIVSLDLRLRVQEARKQGQADILKPAMAFLSKHWLGILVVGYIGWSILVEPWVGQFRLPHSDRVAIEAPL